MQYYDVIIIGGGITGCAAAYEFSKYDFKTALLEKENDVACGSTKANSAIIHAGYDPEPGTLMAKYNVRGNALAHRLAKKLDIPFRETGSLVLAFSDEEVREVRKLYENGVANGVPVEIISGKEVLRREPNISDRVRCALWAPTGAVISPWEFAAALIETAVTNGVDCYLSSGVKRLSRQDGMFEITAGNHEKYRANYIVNAAGLYADKVYEMAGGSGLRITPVRGEYFLFDKTMGGIVSTVVFQCPTKLGKGAHGAREPIRRARQQNSGGPRRYCDPYGRAGICPADGGEIRADDRFFAEHPELCGPASRGGRRFCGRGVGDSQLYQRRGGQIARAFFRTRNRGRPCADIGRLRSRPAQEAGVPGGTPGAAHE